MFFPYDVDRSGTGVVYYVMEPRNYDPSTPIDAADYAAWVQSWMEDAHEIAINYQDLDAENLSKLQE